MYKIANKKGITFLQVILVLILIGILSSIAFVAVNRNVDKAEFSSKQTQASILNELVSKYTLDNGEVPTVVPQADYLEKPALIDIKKVALDESSKFVGNYYIYGVKNKVYYDYPPEYIAKVRDKYVKDKNNVAITGLISGTQFIDVALLYKENYLEYSAQTSYMLNSDGTVVQSTAGNTSNADTSKDIVGIDKPTTPIIIPNRTAPYYSNQTITFTAQSNYQKGTVTYTWSGGYKSTGVYGVGTYSIEVIAVGSDGVKSDKATFQLVVSKANSAPTKPTVTYTPTQNITSSTNVTLTASSTDPDGDAISYKWISQDNIVEITSSITKKFSRGSNTITVYAVDQYGNNSDKTTITLNVTNSAPVIKSVTQTPNPATKDDKVDLVPVIEDVDGDLFTYEITGLSETKKYNVGTTIISVIAKDSLGATSAQFNYSLVIANRPPTKPTLSMTPSSGIRPDTNVTFTASGSVDPDGDAITYEWSNKQAKYAFGTYTVKVRAVDSLGLTSDWAETTFTVGNNAPTIPSLNMSPNATSDIRTNTVITFTASGSVDPDGDAITYEWDNKTSTYPIGTNTVRVRAVDTYGTASSWQSVTFTVNNSAPTIPTIAMSPLAISDIRSNTFLSFTGSGSTDADGHTLTYQWNKDGAGWTTSSPNGTYSIGSHTVQLRAVDSLGAISSTVSVSFTVNNSAPTTPTITMSPSSSSDIRTNTYIYFTASGSSDVDGHSITYQWNKDGAGWTTTSPNGLYSIGSHTVQLRAVDSTGLSSSVASTSFTVNNTVPTQPSISMSPNSSLTPSTTIYFSAYSTDIDGDYVSYEWNVDGAGWTSTVPNGTFSAATHTVYVRAKDSRAAYSTQNSITFTVTNIVLSAYYENAPTMTSTFSGCYACSSGGGGNYATGGYQSGQYYYFAANRYIDLGTTFDRSKVINATFSAITGGGSSALTTITYYVSADNVTWTQVGTASASATVSGVVTISSSQLSTNFRYVRASHNSVVDYFNFNISYYQ